MKNLLLFTVVVMLSPVFLKAQNADPELEYIKATYSKEKKAIVDEYMGITEQEATRFWSLYGAYESQREKLAVDRLNAIREYVDNADNISPELANKIATATLNNTISLAKLNLEYYGKFKKDIGAIKAAKFIQLETYLQTAWRGFVQENIPMISELDKTQKH